MQQTTKQQAKTIFKIITSTIGWFLLVAITVLSVYSVYNTVRGTKGLNMLGGTSVAVVLSGSMGEYPATGDLVVIKRQDNYYVGDIITFQQGGVTITHRIISMEGAIIITQGDANNTADAPITKDAIYGKVVNVVPSLGYVVSMAQQPNFIALVISFALFVSVLMYLYDQYKKYKTGNQTAEAETQTTQNLSNSDTDLEYVNAEIEKIKQEIATLITNKKQDKEDK